MLLPSSSAAEEEAANAQTSIVSAGSAAAAISTTTGDTTSSSSLEAKAALSLRLEREFKQLEDGWRQLEQAWNIEELERLRRRAYELYRWCLTQNFTPLALALRNLCRYLSTLSNSSTALPPAPAYRLNVDAVLIALKHAILALTAPREGPRNYKKATSLESGNSPFLNLLAHKLREATTTTTTTAVPDASYTPPPLLDPSQADLMPPIPSAPAPALAPAPAPEAGDTRAPNSSASYCYASPALTRLVVGLGLEKESTGAGAGAGASEPGELERELAHYGYQVILFPELAELAAFLEKHERAAQILLVPLELYESDKAVANFIDNRLRFASPGPGPAWGAGSSVSLDDTPISPFPSPSPSPFLPPPLPVAGTVGVGGSPALIFISERNDATARLQAVRAGGEAFISRPINLTELVAQMDALTPPVMPSAYRILIVDDSPTAAAFYATTLQMAGMVTVTCRNSQQLLDALVEFGPDLILLDIYMPDCNGLEVAAMLRQLPGYVAIPIVFLTAETALDIQLKALQLGSDDFLTKPIHSEHLISLVRSRIERSRLLRSLMERDSLTDLLNHSSFKEQLTIELARATRHNTALVVAILDIDYFKLVNDRYGHLVGDQVLKSLARLLRGGLRQTDAAGRVGGEEFAVVL